jgi:hypothetical protein
MCDLYLNRVLMSSKVNLEICKIRTKKSTYFAVENRENIRSKKVYSSSNSEFIFIRVI